MDTPPPPLSETLVFPAQGSGVGPGASPGVACRGVETPQVPGYTLTNLLGTGSTAVVWRAVQLSTGRPVALRLWAAGPAAAAAPWARRRFRREADLITRLEHPHI